MSYPYGERMNKLKLILAVNDQAEKKGALKDFIREEEMILSRLSPPETKSGALTTAQSSLLKLSLAVSQSSLFLSPLALPTSAMQLSLNDDKEKSIFSLN